MINRLTLRQCQTFLIPVSNINSPLYTTCVDVRVHHLLVYMCVCVTCESCGTVHDGSHNDDLCLYIQPIDRSLVDTIATYGMTMLCLSSPTHGRSPRFYDEPNLKGGGSTNPSQKALEPTIPVTTRIRQVTKDGNDGSILQTPPRKRLRRMPLSNIDSPPPIIPKSENRWSSSSLSSSSSSSLSSIVATTTTTTSSHPFPSSQGIFPSSNRTREETSGWCASMMTLNPRQPLLLPPPPLPPATLEWTGRTSHIIWLRPRPVKLNHRDGILDETLFGSTKNSHSLLIPS